jgi:hypothetical protein
MPEPTKADYVLIADVYNGAQVAVFRTRDKLCAWLNERDMELKGSGCDASAHCVTDKKTGVDWFLAWIPDGSPAPLVSHECLHLAWYVLESYGIKVDYSNHEALAYLQQHFTRQCLARLDEIRQIAKADENFNAVLAESGMAPSK